jgi:hypothetical protein
VDRAIKMKRNKKDIRDDYGLGMYSDYWKKMVSE